MIDLDTILESVARQGFTDLGFRFWGKYGISRGGTVSQDAWHFRAWRPGSTDVRSGMGRTAEEALARALTAGGLMTVDQMAKAQHNNELGEPPLEGGPRPKWLDGPAPSLAEAFAEFDPSTPFKPRVADRRDGERRDEEPRRRVERIDKHEKDLWTEVEQIRNPPPPSRADEASDFS